MRRHQSARCLRARTSFRGVKLPLFCIGTALLLVLTACSATPTPTRIPTTSPPTPTPIPTLVPEGGSTATPPAASTPTAPPAPTATPLTATLAVAPTPFSKSVADYPAGPTGLAGPAGWEGAPPEVLEYAKDWPLPGKDYANTRHNGLFHQLEQRE